MQLQEAVILAGGFGTRLRSEVLDTPKCLAPVAGHPFLYYVIRYLQGQNVTRFIFSIGYLHEQVINYLDEEFGEIEKIYSIEDSPLGTGGAILAAAEKSVTEDFAVVNGDTLFKADLQRLMNYHLQARAACTLALKPMKDYDRYGSVDTTTDGTIIGFAEKSLRKEGNINGGLYLINRNALEETGLPEKFSFEKDYLEKYNGAQKMIGICDDGYFIDIGIPEDLRKANVDFKTT